MWERKKKLSKEFFSALNLAALILFFGSYHSNPHITIFHGILQLFLYKQIIPHLISFGSTFAANENSLTRYFTTGISTNQNLVFTVVCSNGNEESRTFSTTSRMSQSNNVRTICSSLEQHAVATDDTKRMKKSP